MNYSYLIISAVVSFVSGLTISIFSARRAARRAEVRHSCDKIESIISDLIKFCDEYHIKKGLYSAEVYESRAEHFISMIEMRHGQIKSRGCSDFIKNDQLVQLRILTSGDEELTEDIEPAIDIPSHCLDILETIEEAYTTYFSPSLMDKTLRKLEEYYGYIIAIMLIALAVGIAIIFGWFFNIVNPTQY